MVWGTPFKRLNGDPHDELKPPDREPVAACRNLWPQSSATSVAAASACNTEAWNLTNKYQKHMFRNHEKNVENDIGKKKHFTNILL